MHHAGLGERDRKLVERLFVEQKIQVRMADILNEVTAHQAAREGGVAYASGLWWSISRALNSSMHHEARARGNAAEVRIPMM